MAPPPSLQRLTREDLRGLPREVQPGFERLLLSLNPFLTSVASALSRRLTFTENMAAIFRTVDFTAASPFAPQFVSTQGLQGRPSVCLGVRCELVEGSQVTPTAAPRLAWEVTIREGKQGVLLSSAPELTAGKRYRLTVLIAA